MADDTLAELQLESVIGFNGHVPNGLKVHPDREHLIYPLGNTVCIEHITTKQLKQLTGHNNNVSCIAVSKSGRYLASGQITYMGFKADIIVWDFHRGEKIATLSLHKVKVQDLAFSPNEKYLVSLGGQDDGSVVVWNLEKQPRIEAICGHPAQVESAGVTNCVAYSVTDDNVFVTGGEGTLRVWKLDVNNRKIRAEDVNMGSFKRIIKCILMADHMVEPFILCGTTTGDIIGINYNTHILQVHGPVKDLFSKGVGSMALMKNQDILVGCGDGEVAVVKFYRNVTKSKKGHDIKEICLEKKKSWRDKNLKSLAACEITSIALRGEGHQFFIGSGNCQIYRANFGEFMNGGGDQKQQIDKKTGLKIQKKSQTDDNGIELIKTCHSKAVTDVCFPYDFSQLIVTCQFEEIRVWDMSTKKELIRHVVANKTCNSVCISRSGTTIHSAWDDGVIRGYGISKDLTHLEEKYIRENAHSKGVTAIACTSDGQYLVTGGGEGQVRIWSLAQCIDAKNKQVYILKLVETMMEHKGKVADVQITRRNTECATASNDGTCIIWDLESKRRKAIFFANTLFKCCIYDDKECQLVASGTDRQLGFFDTISSEKIRELEGAKSGAVNSIALSADGEYFVTGGEDKIVKVWNYQTGQVVAIGSGHSEAIMKVKVSPDQQRIVSVSDDGAILIWQFPYNIGGVSQQMQQTSLH